MSEYTYNIMHGGLMVFCSSKPDQVFILLSCSLYTLLAYVVGLFVKPYYKHHGAAHYVRPSHELE